MSLKILFSIIAILALGIHAGVEDQVVPEEALTAIADQPADESLIQAQIDSAIEMNAINLDKMMADQQRKAAAKYKSLKKRKWAQQSSIAAARKAFWGCRNRVFWGFTACIWSVNWKVPNGNAAKCKMFKEEMTPIEEDSLVEMENTDKLSNKQKWWFGNWMKGASRARKTRWGYRKKRRLLRRGCDVRFWTAQKSNNAYGKQLYQAWFQVAIFPKIMWLLKPKIQESLSSMDFSGGDSSKEGGDVVKNAPVKTITLAAVLKQYVKMSLHSQIDPLLESAFETATGLIWTPLDASVQAVQASLVAAIGTIPYVGGILASAAGQLCTTVYEAVKGAINTAIANIRKLIGKLTVNSIVFVIAKATGFAPGKKMPVNAAVAAAASASKSSSAKTKKKFAAQAAKSRAKANAGQADILKDAKRAGDKTKKLRKKNKAIMKKANRKDEELDANYAANFAEEL